MFSVADFLDRAKAGAGNVTDYRLSKLIGVTPQAISGWRSGIRAPDERAILALCKLSGDNPLFVATMIQSMRAANDDAASLWRRAADKLKGAAAVGAIAVILSAAMPADALASSVSAAGSLAGLCVMSNLLRRFVMRLLDRCRTSAHALG